MTLETLYHLDQIQADQRGLVGDKAFFLSQLLQRGYPIVPGLVVSTSVFRQFLETVTWSEPLFGDLPGSSLYLNVNNPAQLQIVAQQIRSEISKTPLWDDWLAFLLSQVQPWNASALIVRPSVALKVNTDPMLSERISGLLQAQVCPIETAAIAQTIKRVWAELYRARSLIYWQRSGVPLQQISLALLIQPVQSAIAGGDVRINSEELTIRSVWGLGKALSEGDVSPDVIDLKPETGEMVQYHTGDKSHLYSVTPPPSQSLDETRLTLQWVEEKEQRKPSITHAQAHYLGELAQRASLDLKTPLRLEWVLDADGMHITQVNPVAASLLQARRAVAARSVFTETLSRVSEPTTTALTLTGLAASKGQVMATALVLTEAVQWPGHIPPNTALVISAITPDLILQLKQATGLVTDEGTLTSHGAIVAREMGIPAVVGTQVATHHLHTGDQLLIDGDRGIVQRLVHADREQGATIAHTPPLPSPAFDADDPVRANLYPETAAEPSITTPLWVNLSQAETAAQLATLPIDGVGLLRAELMIRNLLGDRALSDWLAHADELSTRIAQYLGPIVRAFSPRPVYYRSLDLRSHEFAQMSLHEPNPILGVHGALSYTLSPELFDIELAALLQLQQAGHKNIHLMLPFVRTVEEVRFCRARARQAGLFSTDSAMQLWIMAEVPSVLFLVPELVAAGVQGISIGSNDLTQLLLAIDRDNSQTAPLFDSQNPAVLRAMHYLINAARQAGIPCSICGQAPADQPEIIDKLVQWGISSISVSPDALVATRQAIAQAEHNLALKAAQQNQNR